MHKLFEWETTMRFRKGNKIRYMQDCQFYCGVPHGIDFKVSFTTPDHLSLTSYGYGILFEDKEHAGDAYGNGSLHVPAKYLRHRKEIRERL